MRYLPAIPDNSLERNLRWWALVLNYAKFYIQAQEETMKVFGVPEQYFGKTDLHLIG